MLVIRKSDLMQTPGLIEIDLSHNEIRSVESRALELKYLTRVQLANNDWSCDCFIKPLKTFLTSKIEYDQLLYKSGLFYFRQNRLFSKLRGLSY